MSDHTEARFARAVLIAFALVGLLHVPAFYALLWIETARPAAQTIEACPVAKGKP